MALKNLKGRVAYIFSESEFDIDRIIGVANIKMQDVEELARIAMRDFEPDFSSGVQAGDLIVGGRNFGYGHPHYPAMRTMRHLGIAGVIAESFFPVYWRGEISMGFPQAACPGILKIVDRFDEIEVDWAAGEVRNLTKHLSLRIEPLSQADREMLEIGGFKAWLKRAVAEDRAQAREKQGTE